MEIILEDVVVALNKNGFSAHVAYTGDDALDLVIDIIERESPKTVALGSSKTLRAAGIYNLLKNSPGIHCIDSGEIVLGLLEDPQSEALQKQIRLSVNSDMFFCGSNAVIAGGHLVNVDMVGNRVSMLGFGPKRVVVVAGRNKIVPDLSTAMARIREVAAPKNVEQLRVDAPDFMPGKSAAYGGPQSYFNNWSIIEKCFPKGRITVILVDENLGF